MAKEGPRRCCAGDGGIGSFIAGTFGTIGITFLAEPVVTLALKFGPRNIFR